MKSSTFITGPLNIYANHEQILKNFGLSVARRKPKGTSLTRSEQLVSAVQQSEFPYRDNLVHLFVGGSELHGAKVKDTDDLDIYGVYLEPPELVLGLDRQDFYVWSTAGNQRRNGPDDTDVCLYSLRSPVGWSRGEGESHSPAFSLFREPCT